VVALRHRNFRLFWLGQVVSLTGTWMQGVASGWLVLTLTNSALLLGTVQAAGPIPVLLLTMFGGVIADRYDKRRILLAAQSLMMLQATLLAVLALSNRIQIWHVVVLAVFLGILTSIEVPTRQAFHVELVGKDDLQNAISLNSTAFNLTRILGPSVAGFILAQAGVGGCFAINAVSFLAVLAGLAAMRGPFPAPRRGDASPIRDLREGIRFVVHTPRVRGLVINVAAISVFGMPYATLMPVIARDVLHGGARTLGFLSASAGVGALAGALALASRGSGHPRFASRARVVLAGHATSALALMALAFSHSFWASAVLLAVIGAAVVSAVASINTLLQSIVPDHLRGRVMAVHVTVFLGFAPLTAMIAGTLAHLAGVPAALLVDGVISLIAAGCFWITTMRRSNSLQAELV
jgi:MFS family permease